MVREIFHLEVVIGLMNVCSFALVVGVLEVKMKQRLLGDPQAIAMRHALPSIEGSGRHAKKKPHKLPQLTRLKEDADSRPHSFETERHQAMDAVQLPSPTRSLIDRHVQHTKHDERQQLEHLPPVAGAFKRRGAPNSLFPRAYQRGELPIMLESKPGGRTLRWTQDIGTLDYSKYFPLFVEGMREPSQPFNFLAREGAFQLLAFGAQHPDKVIDCLPSALSALRTLLDTRESEHIRDALLVLQQLAKIPGLGVLLVPYYRQLLPVLNLFKNKRRNMGDSMDFKQKTRRDVSEMILDTLELLEQTGGPDAFVNIKYMVPTYEGIHR